MRQYLKSYQVVMRTIGPVFVGSGKNIGKKESIWMTQNQLGIPDIQMLHREMAKRRKQEVFEKYLLEDSYLSLEDWLKNHNIKMNEIRPCLRYTLDCIDLVREKGHRKQLQVKECIKDAYGNPYIPGSTLKGMLRTILLGADIMDNPEKYRPAREKMMRNAKKGGKREEYLKKNAEEIEGFFCRVLEMDRDHPGDAVNDSLRGLIVSDSAPLSIDRLVLCQKIDLHVNGEEKKFPLLRECIKPGTEIRFAITVDNNYFNLTKESLYAAVKTFMTCYYNKFSLAYKSAGISVPKANYVYCGGGCGFVSKTIVYPMYGKKDGIEMTQKIFDVTLSEKVSREHKHYKDKEIGASPHTIKCTRCQGQLYQMGLCRIEKMEQTE